MYNINGYNKLSHFIFPINMNYTYNSNSKGIKRILIYFLNTGQLNINQILISN